jgi:hypothetical protein
VNKTLLLIPFAAIGLLAVGCGTTESLPASSSPTQGRTSEPATTPPATTAPTTLPTAVPTATSSATTAPATSAPTATPTPGAKPYVDVCEAVTLGSESEWSQAQREWSAAGEAALTANDYAATSLLSNLMTDTGQLAIDIAGRTSTTTDLAIYHSDLHAAAGLTAGCG